jgi:hypothetical protein
LSERPCVSVMEYFRRAGELLAVEQVTATEYLQSGDKIVVLGTERLRARVMSFARDRIAEVVVIEDLSILLADG